MHRNLISRPATRILVAAAFAGVLAACSSEAPTDAPAGAEPAVLKERHDNFLKADRRCLQGSARANWKRTRPISR